MTPKRLALFGLAVLCLAAATASAQVEPFSKKVGKVDIKDVKKLPESGSFEMPYILWGGDVATFHANGGTETKDGTLFAKQGLKLSLVPGDDFLKQVKDYVEGRSAFLRGTLGMIGLASEVVGADPRTKPVVFLQMTWSQGDHMVSREALKTLADLKGKTIVLQQDGPHVSMLDDVLKTAGLKWEDVKVKWVKDISGKDGPAEAFRKDPMIDACFVISPDMTALTGGLDKKGSGAESTVKGAQVLVSTFNLNHSIADVYACRKDFYDQHRDLIEKFTAGYLKACEEINGINPVKDKKGDPAKYKALCKLAIDTYAKNPATKDSVANEADADGLISDAIFVGLPGNYSFFKEKPNAIGYEAREKAALDLAVGQGYAKARTPFIPVDFDYENLKKMGDLKDAVVAFTGGLEGTETVGKTIYSFTINFALNQSDFSEEKYGADFQKAIELGKLYGNAVIEVRGHADGTGLAKDIIVAGLKKGVFKDSGNGYTYKDAKVDLKDTKKLMDIVDKDNFDAADKKEIKDRYAALAELSIKRSDTVRNSVSSYAEKKGYKIDPKQMKIASVGADEPASIVLPVAEAEVAKNRRVEFAIKAVGP